MTRYCYSKLKNTWLSEDRKDTYKINSYTDPILMINASPRPKGLVVFDIDDTLRVVNGDWSNCQWRTTSDCGFKIDTQTNDTQTRAVNAINTFYDLGYAIAIYTKEDTKHVESSGALNYLKLLASKLSHDNKTKFTQDILVNSDSNIMFGTGTKYGNDKGKGLIKLADRLNIPHNKVLMFDDTNKNINAINASGFCGITVSNTPKICGISDKNLQDGKTFMNSGKCIKPIPNPSKFINNKYHSKGVACAPH